MANFKQLISVLVNDINIVVESLLFLFTLSKYSRHLFDVKIRISSKNGLAHIAFSNLSKN